MAHSRRSIHALLALALAPFALARGDEPPEQTIPAEEVVVVGRRLRTPRDATASATVVSAERFAGEAKGVAELVATAPGVAVNEYGGLGHLTTISIRGSTADGVLVLLDGLPLNTAFGGGVDLSSIPRHWIDRIEVVRGPEGAHYGAGALGGVVNVVTRTGTTDTWSGEATSGSFDTYAAAAEGALERGDLAVYSTASAERTGGAFRYEFDPAPSVPGSPLVSDRRRHNSVRRAGAMAKATARFGSARLDVLAQGGGGRRELPGWPYHLTPRDWQEDARGVVSASLSGPGPWRGLTLASRLHGRFDWLAVHVDPNRTHQRGGAGGIEGEARHVHGMGLLRATVSAENESLRSAGLSGTRSRATFAASASEDMALRGLRLVPALRAERVGSFAGLSGKLGASLRVAGPLSMRASAGRTFRAPSFAELYLSQGVVEPNPDLRPEEGFGADIALVLETPLVFVSAGAHATLYRDLVYYQQVSLDRLKPFNAGKALVRGVELEAATVPARALLGLSVSTSYTLLATEVLRGPESALGKWIPHRARHRVFARASIAPGPAGAHVELHAVGRQYADAYGLKPIPSSLVWNAGGSVRITRSPAIHLNAEIRNVLDDRTFQDGFGNPLPGRTVLFTLRAAAAERKGKS